MLSCCLRFFCCCFADKPTDLLKDKLLPQGSNDGRPNIESTNIHITPTPNYLSLDQAQNTPEDRCKTPPKTPTNNLLRTPPENLLGTPDSSISRSTQSSREGTPNY